MAEAATNIYMKGLQVDSDKEWYHGELTREQAEKTLRDNGSDCFLIRESKGSLVLSLINHGETHHGKITYQLGWYSSDGWPKKFKELSELVGYISTHIFNSTSDELFVAEICKKTNKGQCNYDIYNNLGVTFLFRGISKNIITCSYSFNMRIILYRKRTPQGH